MGKGGGVVEGVGDEEGGELERGQQVGELVAHALARDRIERSKWFVQQEHARLARERTRECRPLAFAPRELSRADASEMDDAETLE